MHRSLDAQPLRLDIAITRHDHRRAVEEQRPRERQRDDPAVPRAQQLFFFAAKAIGTIGSPVACAASTRPGFTTRFGPFGPSGVKTMPFPSRAARIISRSAALPPRVEETRAASRP